MAFTRFIAAFVTTCLLSLGFQSASAGIIGTQDYLAGIERSGRIADVQAALARADVREQLVRLGVDPVAASERVASLSDEELAMIEGKLESLPAGGLLGVIGVVFVVLLILELVGVIDIFKKI